MKHSVLSLALVTLLAACTAPASSGGVTEVAPGSANDPGMVVRERTPGKTAARFEAEAEAIRAGHYVRFEAWAVGDDGRWPRWSCVAYADVSECFGEAGVRIPYRPQDVRIVLEVESGKLEDLQRHRYLSSGPYAQR